MAIRFASTMNAINRGLESTTPNKGADMVEDWETALADLDLPGSKGIARDLGALRKQLEKDEPDGERVQALLHRLGQATTKISERADKQGDKVRDLGDALIEAGDEQLDEPHDEEAAKAPRRKASGKK